MRASGRGAALAILLSTLGCGDDTTSATGGEGGSGGASAGGGGEGAAFTPAAHPDAPQVITYGGPVLASPTVQAILYADDAMTSVVEDFLPALSAASYWPIVTSEYGVGALTVAPPILRRDAPPASPVDESTLLDDLDANTSGPNPVWGPADPNTIYLFVLPEGVKIDDGTGSLCCDDGWDGYHYEALLSGEVPSVPYAVTCQCPGLDGPDVDPAETLTIVISHEIIESATDPFLYSDVAFVETDAPNLAWTGVTGGELADMCDYNGDAYVVPADLGFMVTRSWSNEAALAGDNPCLPFDDTTPYFNSVPLVSDDVTFYFDDFGYDTTGVSIPVGGTGTVQLALFSNAQTSGPWDVSVLDFSEYNGGPKLLEFTLDQTSGDNGDELSLEIHVLAADADAEAEFFIVDSSLDGQDNLWMGVVGN